MPLATALIVAAAAYQAQKKSAEENGKSNGGGDSSPPNITPTFLDNKTSIELLPLEQSLTILESPISTVSFYQCLSAGSLNATIEKLERRVQVILRANPWLGGWLVHGKGVGSFDRTPRLWYDPSGNEMAPTIFQKMSHADVPLNKDTPYIEYEDILLSGNATVKTNPEISNRKEEPLFRIVVIPSPDNNEFALVASMSHICGDGHTFYRVYNMLLGSPIISLIPQRELLYSQKVMDVMGRQEAHYISHIASDPKWMQLFRLGSDVSNIDEDLESSNLKGRVFTINRHWIGNIKADHMTEGNISDICTSTLRSPMTPAFLNELENSSENSNENPTQSTNDILVSWFWNLVNPDVGLMAVNFRGRLGGLLTEDHVGNYANPLPYTRDDYKNAALIRKSLETCRRAAPPIQRGGVMYDVPTSLPRPHPGLTFSIITNWSAFPSAARDRVQTNEDDKLDIVLIRHLPIICPKQMMEKMPKRMSFLVIFSSGPDDIGCMLIAPGRVMAEIDGCGVVKEKIAEF